MCIRANRGAIRVEQQLTGQSVLIPQAGDVLLVNGQLDDLRISAGHCACVLQAAKATPPPQPEVSQLATAEEELKKAPDANANTQPATVETPPAREEPVYQVFMPPLIYDANAKVRPEIDPKMIVLVRRVRVRPTLIFQGRVEGVGPALPSRQRRRPRSHRPPGRMLRSLKPLSPFPLSIVSAISSANCGRAAPNPLSLPYLDCLPRSA